MTKQLPKRAILIVNAMSRRGADVFEEARQKLAASGIELIDSIAVDKPEGMDDAVTGAIERAPMVIVGGGDGSLSESIDHFVGKDAVFALLPLGTANSFARTMGIPLDLDGAIGVIAGGIRRRIDLGTINGDYFLNNAAVGLAPKVAETVPHGVKKRLGRVGYLFWAGLSAASFKAFRTTIDDGTREWKFWATELRIANGRFHGGVELIETADVESGEIVVQAVRGRSLARLGWSYLASAFKRPERGRLTREFAGRELKISTRPRLRVSIDGELGPMTPFTVSIAAAAVTVAAPRDS